MARHIPGLLLSNIALFMRVLVIAGSQLGWSVDLAAGLLQKSRTCGPNRACRMVVMTMGESMLTQVNMYTDGSCLGNPGPGGWCAILEQAGTGYRREFCGGYRLTTNNRMEIMGALAGLEALKRPCQVALFTDSQYLGNALSRGWIYSWHKKEWRKKGNEPVPNADLWQKMLGLLRVHVVEVTWLRGHAGHAENERCDRLARQCAARPDLPPDEIYEALARSSGAP